MWVNIKALALIEEGQLRGVTRLVAMEAAMHSDGQGQVTTSITDLACHIGVSHMTIKRAFDYLIEAGMLKHPRQGRYVFPGHDVPQTPAEHPTTEDSFALWWGENYGPDYGDTFAVLDDDRESQEIVRQALAGGRITKIESVMLTDGRAVTRYRLAGALGTGAPTDPR